MSIDFTILCTRSPASFLKRCGKLVKWKKGEGQLGGLRIWQRPYADGDPLPDDDWSDRVVAVIQAEGRLGDDHYDTWVEWSEALAEATRGAIYSPMTDEFSFVWEADPGPQAARRAQRDLKAGDVDAVTARVSALAKEHDRAGRHRIADELEAIRVVVVADVKRQLKAKPKPKPAEQLAALVAAVYGACDVDDDLMDLVVAIAALKVRDKRLLELAAAIEARRQRQRDDRATVPRTTDQLRAVYEGAAAGDESLAYRRERFAQYQSDALRNAIVRAIAAGWNPTGKVAKLATEDLDVERLTDAQFATLDKLTATKGLARSAQDAARTWRGDAGKRASDYSLAQWQYYERYRDDPRVGPFDRSMEMAMYRSLNDALYGMRRTFPRMPETIIALICDRRIDEARDAYIAAFGAANVDEAIREAVLYFAPKVR